MMKPVHILIGNRGMMSRCELWRRVPLLCRIESGVPRRGTDGESGIGLEHRAESGEEILILGLRRRHFVTEWQSRVVALATLEIGQSLYALGKIQNSNPGLN